MADTFLNNHIKEQEEVREKAGIEIQRQQRQYQIVTAKIEAETSNALQAIEFSSSAQIETINLSTARSKLRTQKLADENEKKAKLEAAQALITVENNQAKISGAIVQYQEQTRTLQENANSARVVTINEENEKRRILQEQTDDEIRKIRERGKQEIASINEISHKRIKKLRRKDWKNTVLEIMWKFLSFVWCLNYQSYAATVIYLLRISTIKIFHLIGWSLFKVTSFLMVLIVMIPLGLDIILQFFKCFSCKTLNLIFPVRPQVLQPST